MRRTLAALLLTTALVVPAAAIAQSAALLPNGMQQFSDQNGAPYANGKVYFYVPNSTTPKTTWVDPNQATANTNPVTLDSAGRAVIYGNGQYRQQLYDQFGTLVWDKLTAVNLLAQSATNVISTGADPTGQNDSAAAFQSAFDTCSVYIPAGTYKITFTLNTGNCKYISYVGAGSGVVDIINATADQTSFVNNANGGDFTGMTWDRAVAAVGSNAIGLNFAAATDYMNLYDVITKNSNPGIWLGVAEYSVAQNVIASMNYGDGFFITDSFVSGEAQWTLLNVLSQENNGWGYDVRALGSTILQLVQWTNVSSFANNNGGILLDGTSTTNRIEGFTLTNGQLNTDGGDEIQMKTYAYTPILVSNTQISLAGTGPTGRLLGTPASNIGFGMDLAGTQVRLSVVQSILAQNSQGGLECNPGTVTDSLELIGDIMELNGTTSPGIGASLACTPISTVVTGGSYGNRTGSSNQAYGITIQNGNGVSLEGVNVPANATAGISITSNANLAFCFGIQGESMTTIGCDSGGGGGGGGTVNISGVGNIVTSPNPISNTGTINTIASPTFSNIILPNNGNIDLGTVAVLSGNGTGVSLTGAVANGFDLGMGIAPNPTNTYPLGLSTNRWSDLQTNTATIAGNLTTNVTGLTQCLHANSAGVVSGTGSDCGSGGSGGALNPIADASVIANTSGGTALPIGTTISAMLDYQMGNPAPVGSLALRGVSNWTDLGPGAAGSILTGGSTGAPTWSAAGTAGQFLSSAGAGTPVWHSLAGSDVTGALGFSPPRFDWGTSVPAATTLSIGTHFNNMILVTGAAGGNITSFGTPGPGTATNDMFYYIAFDTANTIANGANLATPGGVNLSIPAGGAITARYTGAPGWVIDFVRGAGAPGTVTSITAGSNITLSPSPITGTGSVAVATAPTFSGTVTANGSPGLALPNNGNINLGATAVLSGNGSGVSLTGSVANGLGMGMGISPSPTNTYALGASANLWSNVWATTMTVSGAAGTQRIRYWDTAGSPRWSIMADSGSETGSNVGSDFRISRWNDSGTWIEDTLTIQRSTGITNLAHNLNFVTASTGVTWSNSYVNANNSGTTLLGGTFSVGIDSPTFGPKTDNTTTNGASGDRWTAVWATNGTIQTSDEREKKNIEDSNLGLDFIDHLRPVSFEWKEGKLADGRRHYGLIAQQMEVALGQHDFGGLHRPANDNERYGLNYDELVAPLIKAVQQLDQENKELKREVQDLDFRLRHQHGR